MRANSTLLSGILSCCLPTWLESSRLLLNRIRFAAAERFASARLFSRWFDDLLGGKHVVVVVLMLIVEPRQELDYHGLHRAQSRGRRCRMEAKLGFKYDRDADILYINKRDPYPAQESEELPDEVVVRLNPESGEIENVEVLFFSARLLRGDLFEFPVTADLRLAAQD
jgi:uncharacterized protein YuzE